MIVQAIIDMEGISIVMDINSDWYPGYRDESFYVESSKYDKFVYNA